MHCWSLILKGCLLSAVNDIPRFHRQTLHVGVRLVTSPGPGLTAPGRGLAVLRRPEDVPERVPGRHLLGDLQRLAVTLADDLLVTVETHQVTRQDGVGPCEVTKVTKIHSPSSVVPVWKSSLGSGGSMPLFVNIFFKTFIGFDKLFVQIS